MLSGEVQGFLNREVKSVGTNLSMCRKDIVCTVEHGYNDISLCDTTSIAAHILWYQFFPHC
jgi:hypothetical protein